MLTAAAAPPLGFICYSQQDKVWLDRLMPFLKHLNRLGLLQPWSDRSIDVGEHWYDEIRAKMAEARVVICLVSESFLASDFCQKEEIPFFLECDRAGKTILHPILIEPCLWELEPWLESRQIAPGGGKTVAVDCPSWNAAFTDFAKSLVARLKRWRDGTPPDAGQPLRDWPQERYDWSRLPLGGKELFGRKDDLHWLDAQWSTGTNVASLVAYGGVGKSALVERWIRRLEQKDWDGAERVFGWSFYSQGSHENAAASADSFIDTALRWFGDPDPAAGSAWDRGERLAELVRKQRTLLVLDGLEPLQWASGDKGRIKDPALAALIDNLAADNPGLVLITTREPVTDLADFPDRQAARRDLDKLSKEAGRALLRVRGGRGSDGELEAISEQFGNHALAVSLLASYLAPIPVPVYGSHAPHISTIPALPDLEGKPEQAPRRVIAAFAERFGDGAERQILRLLGLFDRPASQGDLDALRAAPAIPGLTDRLPAACSGGWQDALKRLAEVRLIAPPSPHNPDGLDAHPLVREHFAADLPADAATAGHERLYRYLAALPAKDQPDTLAELQPLFFAVAHGCLAGYHQEVLDEVFRRRINRSEAFAVKVLGAFGATLAAQGAFFDPPWAQPVAAVTEADRAWLLSAASYVLRALGRLAEAVAPMRAGLEMRRQQENWKEAAPNASNLSELLVTLGRLDQAAAAGRDAVDLADRSGDLFHRMSKRATLADARHQQGALADAATLFEQAEALQREDQPQYPRLYSLPGYRTCDLLLSQGRAAEVGPRAVQTLEWVTKAGWLLDIALDHLSLGRAAAALGEDGAAARHHLDRAVAGLRDAGTQQYLPCGLLARAGFRRQRGEWAGARRDLAEARRIADRGGMRLFQIDCDLEDARLRLAQRDRTGVPALVARARQAIEETGYHRRDPELAELAAAIA